MRALTFAALPLLDLKPVGSLSSRTRQVRFVGHVLVNAFFSGPPYMLDAASPLQRPLGTQCHIVTRPQHTPAITKALVAPVLCFKLFFGLTHPPFKPLPGERYAP